MNNSEPARRVELSWFMLFLHWLVRADPEILSGCPTIDRYQMISKVVLLSAVGSVALFAWGAFFFQFWPCYVAVPLTLMVVIIIVMLDQFLGSSRWFLQGVLRAPGKGRGELLSAVVILRLVIAGVTSYATSNGAMMAMSAATIQAEEQKARDAENAAKQAAGAAEKAQTRQMMLGALDAEVKQTTAEVSTISAQLDAARRTREAAGHQLVDNQSKADCQLNGGTGCRRGRGSQYREAVRRQGEAADELRRTKSDIAGLEARLATAERKHDDAVAAFRAREPEFLAAAKLIDTRVGAELVKPSNDPLMSYMALQRVFATPQVGPAAHFYAHLLLALLLVMELSYVLVSEYFGHASIYMVRLIARTKILAAEAADHYRRTTGVLFHEGGERERVALRVIPRFGSNE